MYEVKSIIRPELVASVIQALHEIPSVPGITASVVRGFGKRTSITPDDAPQYGEAEMAKLETVVPEQLLERVGGYDSRGCQHRPAWRWQDLRHPGRRGHQSRIRGAGPGCPVGTIS